MDYFGNIFFAHAALTSDKDGQVGGGDGYCHLQSAVQRGIISDDVVLVLQSLQFL